MKDAFIDERRDMTQLQLSKRSNLPEYIFAKLAREVVKIEQKSGRPVLNFGPGTPDVRPSQIYLDKFKEFVDQPDSHKYPGYGAIPELGTALINWYQTRFNVTLTRDEVLPLLGGKDGVAHLPFVITDPGDEILVPNPGYPAYLGSAILAGAKPIAYDLTEANNFHISLDNLATLLTPRTKFIWINFPSNPTGQIITIQELQDLVDFAITHKLIIVYDNAYSEITFDAYQAPSILQAKGAKDVAIEIGSFSKSHSFAGFRIGWAIGNQEIIKALGSIKSQFDSGLSLPLQQLGAFALSNPDHSWHESMLESYSRRRDVIATKLTEQGLSFTLPRGSLYIWAKIPKSFTSSELFCLHILHTKQVLFTPGTAFGTNGEGYVRVSICINIEHIEEYL